MNNDSEFINIEIDSGVCTVTMNRLEKKNAINPQFAMELCNAWDVIDNDDGVRVAVLKSADSSIFSAGADLKELIPLLKGEIEPTNDYQTLLEMWREEKKKRQDTEKELTEVKEDNKKLAKQIEDQRVDQGGWRNR